MARAIAPALPGFASGYAKGRITHCYPACGNFHASDLASQRDQDVLNLFQVTVTRVPIFARL